MWAHFGERVTDSVVDGAFADLAAFDVRDGNTKGERYRCGREHFVTVGDQEQQIGTHAAENVCEAERGYADGFGHADVGVRVQETFDAGCDGKFITLDFLCGRSKGRGEVRAHDDELEVCLGMHREIFERPVEMAVIGARASDYGYAALHALHSAQAWCSRRISLGL